jgi:2-keto-4-pentenoate hydratase/2-oxohepta-3-ene-1,7-dioic acid hydratase in catechol pathway
MKLVTFSHNKSTPGMKRLGAILDSAKDSTIVDLNFASRALLASQNSAARAEEIANALVPGDMLGFLRGGAAAMDAARRALDFAAQRGAGAGAVAISWPLAQMRLHAPLPRPNSIRDTISFEGHMRNFERRTGRPTPDIWNRRPIYYKGNPDSVIGPDEDIIWPSFTEKLDYELEFAAVLGCRGKNLSKNEAGDYIAGYTIFNDMSARDIIPAEVSANLGPAKGKDFDTGNVIGPWLVTPDEVDASNLRMEARINGEVWSTGNSRDMRWSFAEIVAFMSTDETLHPGDLIGSGTVANGCGDELDRWLRPGDVVELEVQGLGILRNRVIRPETPR